MSADAIPIKIVVSDEEIDAALAKLDTLETGQVQVKTAKQQLEENFLAVPGYNVPGSNVSAKAEAATAEKAGDSLLSLGRGEISALLGITQGRLPTDFAAREMLKAIGIVGPAAMIAMFGLDLIMKKIAEEQAAQKFNEEMARYEARRRADLSAAQRGVMTE